MPSRLNNRRGVYLITPDTTDTGRLLERLIPLLEAAPALVQYRNKCADRALRQTQAAAVLACCKSHDIPLLINDDWALANALGADGVHLGQTDGDPVQAREALGPQAIIGVSCYDSLHRARLMAALDIDYLAFGAVFPSNTKPDAARADLSLFAEAKTLGKATVAIGGIRPDNCAQVRAAGADFIAVISGIFDDENPTRALRAYQSTFSKALP